MNFEEAKNKALAYLARRRLSKKELCDKLKKAGAEDEICSEIANWAEEYGFINDFEYAKSYIADASSIKKYGMKKIRFELLRRGIDDFIIEDVLYELGERDESENICEIIEKKLDDPNDRKKVDKVIRFLVSRGYKFSDIKKCMDEYIINAEFGDDEFDA